VLSPAGASRTKGFLENEARVILLTFFYFGGSVKGGGGAIVHWNVGLISILVKSDENP